MSSDPLHLAETHEWSGLWWLPEAPEERVPGVLRYDPDGGVTLSLIGDFEDRILTEVSPSRVVLREGTRTWEVMHGVAERQEITLLGCIPTRTSRTIGARVKSPDKQTVKAHIALVGVHAVDEDDALFAAAQVSVENLGRWAAVEVFSGVIGAPEGKGFDGSGSISAKPLESTSVFVDGTEFTLAHLRNPPHFEERRGRTTARIRDTVYLQVAPSSAFSLAEGTSSAKSIQDLISLATHRAAGVIWLRLKLTDEGPGAERHPAERYVHVLYSPAAVGQRDEVAVEHHRMFFTCDDIAFEQILPPLVRDPWPTQGRDGPHPCASLLAGTVR